MRNTLLQPVVPPEDRLPNSSYYGKDNNVFMSSKYSNKDIEHLDNNYLSFGESNMKDKYKRLKEQQQ